MLDFPHDIGVCGIDYGLLDLTKENTTMHRLSDSTILLKFSVCDVYVCTGLCRRGQQTTDPRGPAPCVTADHRQRGHFSYSQRGAVCIKCKNMPVPLQILCCWHLHWE